MNHSVYGSTIYTSQDMEETINKWMNKEDMVYMYKNILFHS